MATVKKTLKAVDSSKKPGLAKLPKEVRNKMGYQKDGGKTIKKAQKGTTISSKTEPMKKGSFEDVMGKTLNETDVFSKNFRKSTPAEEAQAAKQAAEMKKKSAAGKAFKSGGMIKRADGHYSKRGLWDNIRANKGSGKKPTAAMLKQEKKIKAKSKK